MKDAQTPSSLVMGQRLASSPCRSQDLCHWPSRRVRSHPERAQSKVVTCWPLSTCGSLGSSDPDMCDLGYRLDPSTPSSNSGSKGPEATIANGASTGMWDE